MGIKTVYCHPYAATALDVCIERTCSDRWLRRPIKVGYWLTDANKRMLRVQWPQNTVCGPFVDIWTLLQRSMVMVALSHPIELAQRV